MHRDLALHNIFLGDNLEIKLGNFGNTRKLTKDTEFRHSICGGNLNYLSPEVLKGKGYMA